jgi:hypothetical protein
MEPAAARSDFMTLGEATTCVRNGAFRGSVRTVKPDEITAFPPVLQLVLLGLLALFVVVSVAARLVPGLRHLWDSPRKAKGAAHVAKYTLLPALVLAVAAAAVYQRWDPHAPLDGGWTPRELTLGPAGVLLGFGLILLAREAGERIDTSDASSGRAFVPLLLMLAGIGFLAFGAITLGRTVKRHQAAAQGRQAALDQLPTGRGGAPFFQIDFIAFS